MPSRTRKALRCTCTKKTLLAFHGITESGQSYVHVKFYKKNTVMVNTVSYSPSMELQCRDCHRWTKYNFNRSEAYKIEEYLDPPWEATDEVALAAVDTVPIR